MAKKVSMPAWRNDPEAYHQWDHFEFDLSTSWLHHIHVKSFISLEFCSVSSHHNGGRHSLMNDTREH